MGLQKTDIVVVTGIFGFIGQNLAKKLNDLGCRVIGCDFMRDRSFSDIRSFKLIDFCEPGDLQNTLLEWRNRSFAEISVVHLGANTDTSSRQLDSMLVQNFEFTKSLILFCEQHSIRMITASSAAVYGNRQNWCEDDSNAEDPLCAYAYSKLLTDNFIRSYRPQLVTSLRFFNVYGPHEEHKGSMMSVPSMLLEEHFNRFRNYPSMFEGSDKYFRDFIYVDDVVRVILHFIDNPSCGQIFNCGTGHSHSFAEIFDIAQNIIKENSGEVIDFGVQPMPRKYEDQYQVNTKSDNTKLMKVGGFTDTQTFKTPAEGMQLMFDYLAEQKKKEQQ